MTEQAVAFRVLPLDGTGRRPRCAGGLPADDSDARCLVRGFRRRRILWSDIEAISPSLRFTDGSLFVALRDGGKVRLPAPVGDQWFGSHDRFLDRAVLLIDCWESYRGTVGAGTAT